MQLSSVGLALIQEFEGYHRKLPDGGCAAYRCQIGNGMDDGKWTIGFGCTEGITSDTVWTRAQADAAFRRELATFEAAVTRLVTVTMTQHQFDALVSFSYNCGSAALEHSTLLRKFNAGDAAGAAASFAAWNKSRGIVVSGLVRRRAAEAAMFRQPAAPSAEPDMPQSVDPPAETVSALRNAGSTEIASAENIQKAAAITGAVSGGAAAVSPQAPAAPFVPAIPPDAQSAVEYVTFAQQAHEGLRSVAELCHQYWWVGALVACGAAWLVARWWKQNRVARAQAGQPLSTQVEA